MSDNHHNPEVGNQHV